MSTWQQHQHTDLADLAAYMYVFNKGVLQVTYATGEGNLTSRAAVSATPSLSYQ